MNVNPLITLQSFGQSVWLDYLRRGMLASGELQQYIQQDGLRGVTSNPAIFEKAIDGSHDYDDAIQALALEGKNVPDIYQALTVADVQRAADLFRAVYDQTEGRDGFVSLEVSPHLAYDTDGTLAEAQRLWTALDRPNVMIKVPATREGLPAIVQLISEGINVNVTLLFALDRYREVADAYVNGLQIRASQGKPVDRVASVASFFLSRIDSMVDPLLEKAVAKGAPSRSDMAASLIGKVAVASAKEAYQVYKDVFSSDVWKNLVSQGARTQRLLWASTSTKNPAYSDLKYVDELIGPETVNTMPLETLTAYRDHGQPASRLEDVAAAKQALNDLSTAWINLIAVTRQLEEQGVQKFIEPFDRLMAALERKRGDALGEPVDRQTLALGSLEAKVQERIASLGQTQFCEKLWRKDPSAWKTDAKSQASIRNALGWLHVAEKMEEHLPMLAAFVEDVRAAGFRHVVHMGMGGSSLAPLVFQQTFPTAAGGLPLTVLDTTDPATILRIGQSVPLTGTLFIVATKSGTTAEPLAFGEYFYAKVKEQKGAWAGENFVAITDPGTALVPLAQERFFRRTFLNFADIGGRYSALSFFGLVPVALMGVNVSEVLVRALRMAHANAACVPAQEAPGVVLGAVMGEAARAGRDKVTLLVSKPVATLGTWLEQLLAESTGKEGTGVLPVAGEALGAPSVYGADRLFVVLRLKQEADADLDRGVEALQAAGHPVVTIVLDDRLDLGQEFFRWEIATAVAGAVLGINPFDQPNVQESKDNTNELLGVVRVQGRLPEEAPALREGPLSFYGVPAAGSAVAALGEFLAQARPGDYLALMAYLTEEPATEQALQAVRLRLRDQLRLATTLGYGPRYLHSTGQFHKGGPNTGLFVQLTADDRADAPIPGQPFTFGVFKRAQAQGDLLALRKHGRRVLRIHLGADVRQGLAVLAQTVDAALAAR